MTDAEMDALLAMVTHMRLWQRRYFKTREQHALVRAKDYEVQVDRILMAYQNALLTPPEDR